MNVKKNLFIILMGALMTGLYSNTQQNILETTSGRSSEYVKEIDGTWYFGGKNLNLKKALEADFLSFEKVTIPHTWNALDAQDGNNSYDRSSYWYYKELFIQSDTLLKQNYIEFTGSCTRTTLYVNGIKAGDTHKGGYTAFRYNVSALLKEGKNILLVRVDNSPVSDIAPLSGDFNIYGGIFRKVYLISVNNIHVNLENYGSSGVFINTGNNRSRTLPEDFGKITVNTELINTKQSQEKINVIIKVKKDIEENEEINFTESIIIKPQSNIKYSKELKIENPVLWNNDGRLYNVTLLLQDSQNKQILDSVTQNTGFRYFCIENSRTNEDGFYLNGIKNPLRGVNRHSFIKDYGSALTFQMHDKDMELIKELGANALRLCHYPQNNYFYDLCDKNGIVVWTEIPLVNRLSNSPSFEQNIETTLKELILQQYNRPSIILWGLENEIGNGTSLTDAVCDEGVKYAKALLIKLNSLVKELDHTGRYTTQAINRDYAMDQNKKDSVEKNIGDNTGWKSDVIAWNIYPGWYPDANFYGSFSDVVQRKRNLDSRAFGISEYGWGANTTQHQSKPALGLKGLSAGGEWHPEEYQNIMNEEALSYINAHDELWGTFYWVMFDFAVDARNEGSQKALNDKGLVTQDRAIKKDSFYLYKANWNKKDKFVYITSKRYIERPVTKTDIKVYSNCTSVSVVINGESENKMKNTGNGVFILEDIILKKGKNIIKVSGDNKNITDECIIECK